MTFTAKKAIVFIEGRPLANNIVSPFCTPVLLDGVANFYTYIHTYIHTYNYILGPGVEIRIDNCSDNFLSIAKFGQP